MKRAGCHYWLASVPLSAGVYITASKWAIRHETLKSFRHHAIAAGCRRSRGAPRLRDEGGCRLPRSFRSQIISNGNTVKNTEYSFLANVLAARGYLVASIQQDIPSDPPLVTKVGLPYVGREPIYERSEANILFVRAQLKKIQPNADYDHLTLVGHSNGGDVSMFFAKMHPGLVSKVITLDNLRVPFVLSDKMKILSFRSKDPNFKTDPGVLPTPQEAKQEGIDIVHTQFQHTWMSDRGPDSAKEKIQATLDQFLSDSATSDLSPAPTDNPLIAKMGPAPYP